MGNIGASWKTTLMGLLGGIATSLGLAQANGHITIASILSGLFILLTGALAKDHNVSNAPSPMVPAQPVEPAAPSH